VVICCDCTLQALEGFTEQETYQTLALRNKYFRVTVATGQSLQTSLSQ